jgi:hypothetical protein
MLARASQDDREPPKAIRSAVRSAGRIWTSPWEAYKAIAHSEMPHASAS